MAAAPIDQGSRDEHVVVFQVADGSFGFGSTPSADRPAAGPRPHAAGPPKPARPCHVARRGAPVVSLRHLLGLPEAPADEASPG